MFVNHIILYAFSFERAKFKRFTIKFRVKFQIIFLSYCEIQKDDGIGCER